MGLQTRIDALKGGLKISNTGNNQDFWGICWGRPTAFLLLLLMADWRRITPNSITHISNALLLLSAFLLWKSSYTYGWAGALCMNLSLSFDCADGQLARYRKGGSELGSFYDKVSDSVGMVVLFSVVGWVVAQEKGDMIYLLLGTLGAAGQITGGYAKWVAMTILHKRGHAPLVQDSPLPLRKYPQTILFKLVQFNEPDLYFWLALGLLTHHLDWSVLILGLTQPPIAIIALLNYGGKVAKSDALVRAGDTVK